MSLALMLLMPADPAGVYESPGIQFVIKTQEGGYEIQWFWHSKCINYVGWIRRTNRGWEETWCEVDGTASGTLTWRFTAFSAQYGSGFVFAKRP